MPLHQLDSGSFKLTCEHDISECWNPYHHGEKRFRSRGADMLKRHHEARYKQEVRRVEPLCMFAGVSFSPYTADAHASGTYAVCPACQEVIMCGYSDADGLGPKECTRCDGPLVLGDYFQPSFDGSSTNIKDVVDPRSDPMISAAEVCAMSPDGIPIILLPHIMLILQAEGLVHGEFDTKEWDYEYSGHLSRKGYSARRETFCRINSCTLRWNAQITTRGSAVLSARSRMPTERAVTRLEEILQLTDEKIKALAMSAYANSVLSSP